MTQRTQRIDELLRQEIGQALERDVTDPGLGFATVTKVETAPDLSIARVWVSVIGPAEQRKETLAALRRAMPFIRRGLNSKIRLRRIPELEVRLDDTLERGTRVLRILDELGAGHVPAEVPAIGESLPTPVRRLHLPGDADDALPAIPPSPDETKPRRRSGPPRSHGAAGERGPGGGRSGRPGGTRRTR